MQPLGKQEDLQVQLDTALQVLEVNQLQLDVLVMDQLMVLLQKNTTDRLGQQEIMEAQHVIKFMAVVY